MQSATAAGEHLLLQLGLQSGSYSGEATQYSRVHFYHRGLEVLDASQTVLVLIHGYPQSAYIWRHIILFLPKDIPLFIPDIPGYGQSTPIQATTHDKRTIGLAILSALQFQLLPNSHSQTKIVIAGHDRGARIAHRLAVDMPPDQPTPWPHISLALQGVILMDIVPTLTQWDAFSNPKNSCGYFHWPFLANAETATAMITAQGGSKFCHKLLTQGSGSSLSGQKSLTSDNAFEIYCSYFDNPETVRATCEDYRAGATVDVEEQEKDQASGRKITVEALVIFAQEYLGSRFDMGKVWRDWMSGETGLTVEGIGEGVGHFLCEEAPVKTAAFIEQFLVELGFK